MAELLAWTANLAATSQAASWACVSDSQYLLGRIRTQVLLDQNFWNLAITWLMLMIMELFYNEEVFYDA